MRKQTKLVAILSAAALLAFGASMTSFAATKGWVEENGVWMYLDSDGDAVTEEWKKSGSQYFWLDENGEMATDSLIEDDDNKYFVDANGARVINDWRQVDNEDGWTNQGSDDEPESIWYYFGSNGKAVTGKKTINGKTYFFDEGGEMFFSWHDHESNGNTYYLGDENEGWAVTGWQWLELSDDIIDDYDDDEYWFHFKSGGDMRKADAGANQPKRAYINGAYYGFDPNGVMVDGWRPAPDDSTATATDLTYYNEENGDQPKGWVFTYTYDDWSDKDDDQQWYYLNSKGKPFNAGGYWSDDFRDGTLSDTRVNVIKEGTVVDKTPSSDGGRYSAVSAKYIKKNTYLFGKDGVMLTGVIELLNNAHRVGGSSDTMATGYYYFNKNSGSSNGKMETGKITVNYDGENYYYNFRKKATSTGNNVGAAYTSAIVDNCLYDCYGVRVDADEGKEYYVLTEDYFDFPITDKDDKAINEDNLVEGVGVIVSSSGKLKSSGTVTIDGTKYTVKEYVAEVAD